MGRRKLSRLRKCATEQAWLAADTPLPEDAESAVVLGKRLLPAT
jgi:hypothetical protein